MDKGPGGPQSTFIVSTAGDLRYWIGARIPVRASDDPETERGTLFLASSGLLTNPFFFQLGPWLWILAGAAALSALCWFPFVRGVTRTIHRLRDATAHIAEGRFDIDPGVRRRDELGELGGSIQRMAAQLDTLVRGQKRFLADAAHELRSPLARMQLAAGILERKTEGDAAAYVDDLKEEIDTMARLTDELLAYARSESGAAQLRLEAVALTPILERAVKLEGADADVRLDAAENLRVIAHSDYLLRAFSNVVRNSVRYAGDAGPVNVKAAANGHSVSVTVSDSGPGVPPEALEKIFTPFYRVEQSRNRKTGGTGLGLAIVRSAIEACKGSVECRNREPSGLEVIVRLPIA
jgi:two-component system sensor histidine kinase CpxA